MARLTGEKRSWFDVPNDPDGARIEIKHLKKGEINDIEDRIELYQTTLRPDADGKKVEREIRVNPAKGDERYAYICAAVTNWEKFFGLDGKPMECSDANKILMAREDEDFGKFVTKCRVELGDIVSREREAAEKNCVS